MMVQTNEEAIREQNRQSEENMENRDTARELLRLPAKILKLRRTAGLSQEELAEALDVSRQAVSRWELGSALPDASNVLALSRIFSVSADYLLNDEFESDNDIPAVQKTNREASARISQTEQASEASERHLRRQWRDTNSRMLGLILVLAGGIGNGIFYLLTCFIKTNIPHVFYQDGMKMQVGSSYMGYSYKWFIKNHNLEAVVFFLWILTAAGIFFLLLPWGRSLSGRIREKKEKARQNRADSAGAECIGDDTKR